MERQHDVFCLESLESRQFLSVAVTATLLSDGFDAGAVDASTWHIPTWQFNGDGTFLGRTQLACTQNAAPPAVEHGEVRLTLDTHNPTGFSFYGTELISNQTFDVGTGLDVKFRAELNAPIPRGVVGGLFAYHVKPSGLHDEVDFELLSNKLRRGNGVNTNVYADEALGAGSPLVTPLPKGGKLVGYHTYEMAMFPDVVQWYVDGVLVRTESSAVPKGPVQVYMNLWAPAETWKEAFDRGIQPTDSAGGNQQFSMNVDSVLVRSLRRRRVRPGISITQTPALGSSGSAFGQVQGINLADYSGVGVFIKVGGGWWTKPTWASPLTSISPDGSWSANVTTGGNDASATEIRAYLIPKGLALPLASGGDLPSSLSSLLYASVVR